MDIHHSTRFMIKQRKHFDTKMSNDPPHSESSTADLVALGDTTMYGAVSRAPRTNSSRQIMATHRREHCVRVGTSKDRCQNARATPTKCLHIGKPMYMRLIPNISQQCAALRFGQCGRHMWHPDRIGHTGSEYNRLRRLGAFGKGGAIARCAASIV